MISLNFTYSDTLNEYVNLLVTILTPHLYDGIMSIYSTSKASTEEKNHLIAFQNLLKATKTWSNDTKEVEYNRIRESSGCNYLNKLIKAVLISNAKVLVGNSNKNSNEIIQTIDISPINFVFKCYLEIARKLYMQPSLIVGNKDNIEKQKDNAIFLDIIKNCINTSVRNSLPIEKLVDNYLLDDIPEKNEYAISEMSSQFQTYLTGYMEEVNKRISEDVRRMMSEYKSENNIKSIDLSPTNSPQINSNPVISTSPVLNENANFLSSPENNSDINANQSLEDSPISTISLNNMNENQNEINNDISIENDVNFEDEDLNALLVENNEEQSNTNDIKCDEVLIDDNKIFDDESKIEVLDNVDFNNNNNNDEYSDSDERRKIEIVGIKGSKKFMTRRERDALRSNNGFTFFDS